MVRKVPPPHWADPSDSCKPKRSCTNSSFSTASGSVMPRSRRRLLSSPTFIWRSSSKLHRRCVAPPPRAAAPPPPPLAPCCASPAASAPEVPAPEAEGGTMMATISATLDFGSFDPPREVATSMKTSPMMPSACARLSRCTSSTEWSRQSLCVTVVMVRSMSITDTCHIASRKIGSESCVALSCVALSPERGSAGSPSLLSAISLTMR
mmetsp:Transcript_36228/g.116654  ORF Transcript_36228/g.116654 Transcript_36228/m.116654 type:complete len:208 (+) Transcript_36228:320-943(+)